MHVTQKRELLPKTGRPLLSETTIPVYPLVSNFLEHSNKSFSIIAFLFQLNLAVVEVGFKKGRESEGCARKQAAMTAARWRRKKDEEAQTGGHGRLSCMLAVVCVCGGVDSEESEEE